MPSIGEHEGEGDAEPYAIEQEFEDVLAVMGAGLPTRTLLWGALLPLMVQLGIATEEEVQAETLEKRLREEAARLHSVSMALGLMHVWTRVP